jgi:hypothetical protein
MSISSEKWKHFISFIQKEYSFGETQEYKNEEGRYHRDNGPALITKTRIVHYQNGKKHGLYCDIWGTRVYYYDDIIVPSHFIEKKHELTLEMILKHKNVEVRHVGLKIYGIDRVFEEKHFRLLDCDKKTEAMLLQFNFDDVNGDRYTFVRVKNSTPEVDGTHKYYFLCVPPYMSTARQAIAWTFGKSEEEYCPKQET